MRHVNYMTDIFTMLAQPHRRAILGLLVKGDRDVGDIQDALGLSQPNASKHLKALREAGLVSARIDAQRRIYHLESGPFRELDAWLEPYRAYWSARLDMLGDHLNQMDDPKE